MKNCSNKEMVLVTKTGKNYGAVLQAYALVNILSKKSYNVRILNHPSKSLADQFNTYRNVQSPRDIAYNYLVYKKRREINRGIERFQEFRSKHFVFTDPYETDQNVFDNPPDADIYVVGSDQVWNPNIRFSPIYFLAFGNDRVHRFSYSASIGIEKIPETLQPVYQEMLQKFNGISVRENTAVTLLRGIGINSINTVDPTLLLNGLEWKQITDDIQRDNNYILVYTLYDMDLLRQTALRIKELTGYKIKTIATSVRLQTFGDEVIWDAGPREFVSLIENASYVVTSSYHGMLFSVNFKKPFFVIPPKSTGSRFIDFLSLIGMEERIVKDVDDVYRIYKSNVPNENVLLDELITFSKKYIEKIK